MPPIPPLSSLPDLLSEKIPDNMKTMTTTLRHLLLVSHAVPADRVSAIMPAGFDLDTIKVGGQSCAILQMVLGFNDNFHYTPLAMPHLDFWQATYRVLTRQPMLGGQPASGQVRREPGAYVFKTFLGTRAAWAVQRAVASGAQYADFNVIMRGDMGRGEYALYMADVQSSDGASSGGASPGGASPGGASAGGAPPTQIAVRTTDERAPAPPFASWEKMTDFLTRRPNSYQQLSVGENIAALPVEHAAMNPVAAQLMPVGGEVKEARLGVWEKMNLLSAAEMRRPYSILIQPEIVVTIHAPRLTKAGQTTV